MRVVMMAVVGAAGLSTAACSSNVSGSDAGSEGDTCTALFDVGPDGGGCEGGGGISPGVDASAEPPTLTISTMGIFVTDEPQGTEQPVDGSILVQYGDELRSDATVKVNGSRIPYLDEIFDVGAGGLTGIGSRSKITIEAEIMGPNQEPITASVSFDCPEEVVITSPAGGSAITGSQPLDVAWSGALTDTGMFGPVVGLYACFVKATGPETTQLGHGDWFVKLKPGQTNAQIPIDGDCERYLLEVRAAGAFVVNGSSGGACYLARRLWLVGK
jgi:hypothetical protein